mmetsp:Transcript_28676/g.72578  ORF Transcript_28676/g.72578 Transcript_28676/m.72578 type:complete len:226 (+) Transcript_28676:150-827(+)
MVGKLNITVDGRFTRNSFWSWVRSSTLAKLSMPDSMSGTSASTSSWLPVILTTRPTMNCFTIAGSGAWKISPPPGTATEAAAPGASASPGTSMDVGAFVGAALAGAPVISACSSSIWSNMSEASADFARTWASLSSVSAPGLSRDLKLAVASSNMAQAWELCSPAALAWLRALFADCFASFSLSIRSWKKATQQKPSLSETWSPSLIEMEMASFARRIAFSQFWV